MLEVSRVSPVEDRGVLRSAARRPSPPAATAGTALPVVYGLDIETDTTVDGLDPRVARIVAVAVAGPTEVKVFDDADEPRLLDRLDGYIAAAEPGVITTWNGAAFDLPFLADRARRHCVPLGLELWLDPGLRVRAGALPGHLGAYRATWHRHVHLDAYRVFRADVVPALGVSGGLKAIARVCGLTPIEVRTEALHELSAEQIRAYVASDARCTRELIRRRWPSAQAAVDQVPLLADGASAGWQQPRGPEHAEAIPQDGSVRRARARRIRPAPPP